VFLPVVSEVALEPGADPWGVALSPGDQRHLYITGHGTNKVYKIDTTTHEIVGQSPVGTAPKGVAITPDGQKVYIANTLHSSLSVLDAGSLATLTTIPLSGNPEYVTITMDGSTAAVAMSGVEDVAFVDVVSDTVVASGSSGLSGLYFPVSPLLSSPRRRRQSPTQPLSPVA
jgi:YVTN family beta-propeller protein